MNNFDLKKFLTENKLTSNSKVNEAEAVGIDSSVMYNGVRSKILKKLPGNKVQIIQSVDGDLLKPEVDLTDLRGIGGAEVEFNPEAAASAEKERTPKPAPKPKPEPKPEPTEPSIPDEFEGTKEFSVYTFSGDFHHWLEMKFDADMEMHNDQQYFGDGTVKLTYDQAREVEQYGAHVDYQENEIELTS